jgi:hypothetical protein
MLSEIIQTERWSGLEVLEIRRHATTSSVAAPWIRSDAELALRTLVRVVASSVFENHSES